MNPKLIWDMEVRAVDSEMGLQIFSSDYICSIRIPRDKLKDFRFLRLLWRELKKVFFRLMTTKNNQPTLVYKSIEGPVSSRNFFGSKVARSSHVLKVGNPAD